MTNLLKDLWSITLALLEAPFKIIGKVVRKLERAGWRKILLATMMSIVLLAVTATIFFEVTSQPRFCVSCHYMAPYFASWEGSSHQGVHCTECHIPPGLKGKIEGKFTALSMLVNYATGIYKRSKPWAEINDENCLRGGCHETRLLEGRVPFKQGIVFDHKPHLGQLRLGKKLRCTSCHSQIVQGQHIAVTTSTCFICHFKGDHTGQMSECTTCHEAPVRTDLTPDVPFDHSQMLERKVSCLRCHGSMQVGSGAVQKERCNSCHAELGKIEKFDDVELIHNNHITKRKVDCQACHQEILHHSVSRTEQVKPSCEDCHKGLHEVQRNLFTGEGGVGVAEQPSTMFLSGLNCHGCHIIAEAAGGSEINGVTYKASGVVCTPCHDAGYDRILEGWKRRNAEKLSQIASIKRQVAGATASTPSIHRSVADSLLRAADHNIQMVDAGHGIHNIPFAESLLETAYNQLQSAYALSGRTGSLPRFETGLPKTDANCMTCHYGVETMVVKRAGRDFPHSPHVLNQKLACTTCHSNEMKHGTLSLSREACNQCHHKPPAEGSPDCAGCHELQASIQKGDASWGAHAIPDPMFESGMGCLDCHGAPDGSVARPTGETCVNCHEPGYDKLLAGWKSDFRMALTSVDSLLHLCRKIETPELSALRSRLDKLRKDRSLGVHNYAMVDGILKADNEWLVKFVKEHGLSVNLALPEPAE